MISSLQKYIVYPITYVQEYWAQGGTAFNIWYMNWSCGMRKNFALIPLVVVSSLLNIGVGTGEVKGAVAPPNFHLKISLFILSGPKQRSHSCQNAE